MSLINFKDIDCKQSISTEPKIVNFNGSNIQIVNYLSFRDKYDLIMITLQKSLENGIYNEVKLEMFFELHLIYMYSNIIFDKDAMEDEEKLYDILKQSGLISLVLENISSTEICELKELISKVKIAKERHDSSFMGMVKTLVQDLPEKMKNVFATLQTQNPELMNQFIGALGANMLNMKENEE